MGKPHNGPSAVLVLNGTSHNVIQDAIGFSVFGLAGFPSGFLVDCWIRWSSPQKIILGAEDPPKFYSVIITMDPLPPKFWVQRIG